MLIYIIILIYNNIQPNGNVLKPPILASGNVHLISSNLHGKPLIFLSEIKICICVKIMQKTVSGYFQQPSLNFFKTETLTEAAMIKFSIALPVSLA